MILVRCYKRVMVAVKVPHLPYFDSIMMFAATIAAYVTALEV